LYLFAVHSLTTRDPFLDPRLIMQRRFFVMLLFISFYGFLSVPPLVMMPTFLDHVRGYTVASIGLLQSPRGVGMLAAMLVSGRIAGRIDPRVIIAGGLICLALTNYEMSTWTAGVGEQPIIWTGFLQGIGAGIILVPIQLIAFPTLPSHQRTEATSVFNLVRSVCSSIGVSLALTMFVVSSARNRASFVEHVSPYSAALRAAQEAGTYTAATQHGLAILDREIELQAAVAAYNSVFLFLAVASLAALPLLLLVGRPTRTGKPASAEDAMLIAE